MYIFDELFRITQITVNFLIDKYPTNDLTKIFEHKFNIFSNTIASQYSFLASVEINDGNIDPLSQDLQSLLHNCFKELEIINGAIDDFVDVKKLGRELRGLYEIDEFI